MSKYVDGELPAADIGGLRDHLVECESCRAQLQNWKEQAALMGKVLDALWRPERKQQWSVHAQSRTQTNVE